MAMISGRTAAPVLILVCLLLPMLAFGSQPGEWLFVLPTDELTATVKTSGQASVTWCTIGEQTLVRGGTVLAETVHKTNKSGSSWAIKPDQQLWLVTTKMREIIDRQFPAFQVVLRSHGLIVLMGTETDAMGLAHLASDFTRIEPLPWNQVLLTPPLRGKILPAADDPLPNLLEGLDMEAFWQDLLFLESCRTRYSYAASILPALAHAETAFRDMGLTVRRQPFTMAGATCDNLEAMLVGTDPAAGEVMIVGHLDSTSQQPKTLAPGADDNGTGAAGVVALARFLTGIPQKPKATVRFVLFLGEEQGLTGSKAYVRQLSPETLKSVRAVLNMDMIGFDRKAPLSLLLETYSFVKPLAEEMATAARTYTELEPSISYNAWGSDHIPFLQQKVPTVLTIEEEFEANPHYHKTTDTSDQVNRDLCREILKLNAVIMLRHGGCLD